MIRFIFPFVFIVFFLFCTNHSSSPSIQIPPLLVTAVNNQNSTFTLTVRATNPELIFQGYRLFVGQTENDARNSGDLNAGTDCSMGAGTMTVLPVQPTVYTFLIDPSESLPVLGSGIACKFRILVSSGSYISVRSLGLSIQTQNSSSTLRVSGPSNAILLP
ncbi:MAG: hypothetical protein SH817_10640 [Leptospira sp.]|nr:hypothetical protein [Leptospira sp.]